MKVIDIKFPNGAIFQIPAEVVAKARTSYYADQDGFLEDSKEWFDEFDLSLSDSELYDWLQNNMDWKDISNMAVQINPPDVDYDKMFFEAEIQILKKY